MPFNSATMAWEPDPPARKRQPRKPGPVVEFEEIRRGGESIQPETSSDDLGELVSTLTVAEVIELAESGMADLDDIIEAERGGKARKSVLALVKSESGKVYARYNEDSSDSTE